MLKEGAEKEKATTNGATPLYVASQEGKVEVVEVLLKEGADKDKATTNGWTPLYIASQRGKVEVVELLLKEEADKEKATTDGKTPLYTASSRGHKEVIEMLLRAGAKIDNATKSIIGRVNRRNGKAIIHYLVEFKMCDKILGLDLSSEEINALSRYDRNVVHYAVASNADLALVKMLVEAGCKLGVKDKGGSLPIDIALKANNLELFTLLYEKMDLNEETKSLMSEIKKKVERSRSKLIKSFLNKIEAADVGKASDKIERAKRKQAAIEGISLDLEVELKKMKKDYKGKKRKGTLSIDSEEDEEARVDEEEEESSADTHAYGLRPTKRKKHTLSDARPEKLHIIEEDTKDHIVKVEESSQ